MYIYIIVGLAVAIPFFAPRKYKQVALVISLLLLLIPWGFQYRVSWDWPVYVERWQTVQYGENIIGNRTLEPGYVWLMQLCHPIGFFGFLILCGIFVLSILYLFIKKYVSPKWYWLSILILMSNMRLGFLLIDTNRQTLSLDFSMLATYLLLYDGKRLKIKNIYKYIISLLLLLFATQIHTSAYFAFILLFVLFFVKYVSKIKFFTSSVIFNIFYWGRYFMNISAFQGWMESKWLDISIVSNDMSFFTGYMEQIGTQEERFTFTYYFVSLFLCHAFLFLYNRLSVPYKFFGMSMLLFYMMEGYMLKDLPRVLVYMNIYSVLIIPRIFQNSSIVWNGAFIKKSSLLSFMFFLVVIIYCWFFHMGVTQNKYYERWSSDFRTTIFDAPKWM